MVTKVRWRATSTGIGSVPVPRTSCKTAKNTGIEVQFCVSTYRYLMSEKTYWYIIFYFYCIDLKKIIFSNNLGCVGTVPESKDPEFLMHNCTCQLSTINVWVGAGVSMGIVKEASGCAGCLLIYDILISHTVQFGTVLFMIRSIQFNHYHVLLHLQSC
jgi:hypothetical protein